MSVVLGPRGPERDRTPNGGPVGPGVSLCRSEICVFVTKTRLRAKEVRRCAGSGPPEPPPAAVAAQPDSGP